MVPPRTMRNTPAATAPPASPARSPAAARCVATSDEEQAVCVARHGPADAMRSHQHKKSRVQLVLIHNSPITQVSVLSSLC